MNVVLLHAWPLDERMWDPLLPALREPGFEPFAPRLYGRGGSIDRWAAQILDEVDGPFAAVGARWRRGEDLEAFIAAMQRVPLRAGGFRLFSAHQMSSCRMGDDPSTSVANPWGELHDTPGVHIGDASALPTAAGVNPMISTMALAHRTAAAIVAAAPPVRAAA